MRVTHSQPMMPPTVAPSSCIVAVVFTINIDRTDLSLLLVPTPTVCAGAPLFESARSVRENSTVAQHAADISTSY
jgi:hypothetical protein